MFEPVLVTGSLDESDDDEAKLRHITSTAGQYIAHGGLVAVRLLFGAGARRVLLPLTGAPEVRTVGELRAVTARPVELRAFHDAAGLFVADASLFPGPIGINRGRLC